MKEGEYSYHQWSAKDLARHFDADFKVGLSGRKALFRLEKHGTNSIRKESGATWLPVLKRQFSNFFIWLLLVAAVISFFVDGIGEMFVLVAIVVVNVILGFYQEYQAERALLDLGKSFQIKCKVLRDGKIRELNSEELTLGDIVLIEQGDRVPADLRVIVEESLRLDESMLTGESIPVGKNREVLSLDTILAERRNMLYSGTLVVAGHGTGIVVAVGKKTEIGKIAESIDKEEEKTPLEKQVNYLGRMTSLVALAIAILIFILGYIQKTELLPLLTLTIAVFIAAVPESLPTAITLALSVGASRMAKKNAIVRRMSAIETLGTTQIIATDKTGTLTNNILKIELISLYNNGSFRQIELSSGAHYEAADFLAKALACSSISIKKEAKLIGDPVEVAIAEGAREVFAHDRSKPPIYKKILEMPFDSDKKYMSVLVEAAGREELIVKGMPERVVDFCGLGARDKRAILLLAAKLSSQGYKVLGLACKRVKEKDLSSLSGLEFLGLISMADEPSEGVREAIERALLAGIRPVIITGDHAETARFVAEKLGLKVKDDEIISGQDLEKLSPQKFASLFKKIKIFARITPTDKINIVKMFKKSGYSVAVTGDGVNDAPALREADAGIAMGIKGTDVSRDAADVILLDDQFGTILSAIEYGRTIYDNIKNVIVHLLAGNFSEIFLVGAAFLFGLPMPITTIQILWVNLITDSLPALALSLERPSKGVLLEKPRSAKTNSLNPTIKYSAKLSIVSLVLCLVVYLWGLHFSVAKAQTLTFCFFVAIELIYCLSIRSKYRIWQNPRGILENKYLLAAIAFSAILQIFVFLEPFRSIFGLVLLNSGELAFLAIMTVIAFFAAEFIRAWEDRKKNV